MCIIAFKFFTTSSEFGIACPGYIQIIKNAKIRKEFTIPKKVNTLYCSISVNSIACASQLTAISAATN